MRSIHDLELHEELRINGYLRAIRVLGGWIYIYKRSSGGGGSSITSVFVPKPVVEVKEIANLGEAGNY